jgi:uncharacterized phage protein (TIGR02218 family)
MSDPWLQGSLTSAVYGWRLERRDGVTLGFTSHDRDIELDGLLHRASPGMEPSSILESIGLDTDGLDVQGAIDSSALSETDLIAGRWDNAKMHIYLFDWTQPLAGKRLLAIGELGEVSFSNTSFRAELRGLTSLLDAPIVPQTSPGCRATFCDAACGLNPQRFTHIVSAGAVTGERVNMTAPLPGGINNFAYGCARWINGPNCGILYDIINSGPDYLILARPPADTVHTGTAKAGTNMQVIEGCDKTLATCSARFGNAVNFRGEPHLPGNDLLTRYPGAG